MAAAARYYQRAKNGVHAIQAFIIFLGACITIAIYTKGGQGDGRINYYFVLCWLCIPALVYQTAFPTFERTKRFANAYAHAVIDIVYTIWWFAAFIAVVMWVKQGSHAAKGWNGKDTLCDRFAWGPTSKCKLGQATAALAAIICLLFVLTAALSFYGVWYYRSHGYLPAPPTKKPEIIHQEDPEDYAFSANPHDKLDQREELEPMHQERNEVSSLHQGSEGSDHRERRMSWDRRPTPELPMRRESPVSWNRPISPEMSMHQEEVIQWDRQRTPDLPMGEGYYTVDTSYHGGGPTLYDPPQQQQHQRQVSGSSGIRTPSPLGTSIHSNESSGREGLKPYDQQPELHRFSWEHSEYSNSGRIDFPNADYSR